MKSPPRPWPKGQPHPTRGWKAPWRRTWGSFRDGRSKLSNTARRINRELVEERHPRTASERRRVWLAARYLAVIEMTLDQAKMNGDLRSVRRTIVGLQASADRQLAGIEGRAPVPATPAELLALMQRAGDG